MPGRRTSRYKALLPVACLALSACSDSDDGSSPLPPPPDEPSIALEPAYTDLAFTQPVLLLRAPGDDTRWFVVEQPGVVRVFEDDPAVDAAEVFLDIGGRVDDSFNESGLLGLAFHPGFPDTPYVYVSYTATGTGGIGPLESRIARFTTPDGGATLDAGSETVLLTAPQHAGNHNGGHVLFGPDGLLYIGFGDGGGGGDPEENAQDPTNLLGSLLSIDVDGGAPYAIPPGNPFAANVPCPAGGSSVAAPCPEIFAWGFRNPWRFSFDSSTGTLWAGDVGQDTWEEVDRVEAGNDYGWDDREGAHCFEPPTGCDTASVDPIAEYSLGGAQSVTGGFVYRGNAISGLDGYYVFADFIAGIVFAVAADAEPTVVPDELLDTDMRFSTFAEDLDGELLLVDYAGGTLHRIVAGP
ncbi:MAG TPA: PQQ-dependent sugar dehydrogenase [Woeseiaceae bacterium]|nr:PQQ-dependent sugar dehydrogenase [Woeseiaceae bacterium]